MAMDADTVIVGASASGLAVARCLEEAGGSPIVIDAASDVGSMCRKAYERLHLHTPRGTSGLPFLPMPASYPRYPSRQQVVDYLVAYAATLRRRPEFGRPATYIRRDGDGWIIDTPQGVLSAGAVVLATGNTRVPVIPHWSGEEGFGGGLIHSSAYRTGAAYRGRRVLVVGFGNSACEIAIDLVEQGASPTLSVRGPVNIIPRDLLGIPIVNLGLVSQLFPPRIADAINAPLLRLALGDTEGLGFRRPPYGPIEQIVLHRRIPLLDIGTISLIRKGDIAVRPGVSHFTGSGVAFEDGREEQFDAVVLATGYRAALGDLLPNVVGLLDADGTPLTSGTPTVAPGLYFCGFAVTPGGMLRSIGREARAIAADIAGPD
jgi:cation diffusion facilitator CzcD-associated flavoprotein CzcO